MHSKNIRPGSFFSFKFLEVYLCHREFLFALTAFKFTFMCHTFFFLKNRIHCFNLETKYANPFGVNIKILTKSQVQLHFIFATAKKSVVDFNFNPPLTSIQFPAISTFLSLITANSL